MGQQTLFEPQCRGVFLRSHSPERRPRIDHHRVPTASVAEGNQFRRHHRTREIDMAKGEQRSNREAKKPKKGKIKVIAAAPSQKGAGAGWQPTLGSGKKK